MSVRLFPVVLAALAAVAIQPAAAGICAQFSASDISVTYDPLGSEGVSQIVRPISLRVARGYTRSNSQSAASIRAQFVDNDSNAVPRIGNRGPIYTIENSQPVVVSRYEAPLMPNRSFGYSFQSKHSGAYESIHGLQFYIDPGQDVPAGAYDETLGVQYICNTAHGGGSPELQSGVLHVNVSVPSKLIANLSGGASSGTVDFGDFSERNRRAMVNVYSTGPFSVKIESDNRKQMLLDGASSPGQNARIDYALWFDGYPVTGYPLHFPRTGIGGAGLPLLVRTEDTHGKRAGYYRDALTITVTPTAF